MKFNRLKKSAGFTLVEMVIAISLLAIMLAIAVFSFDGARSRAQVLVSAMDEYGNGEIRMRTDIGCYSTRLDALLEKPIDAATGTTYCDGAAAGANWAKSFSNWAGPYIKAVAVGATGEIQLTTIAPTITLRMLRYKDTATNRVYYYVVADGVPIDIAKHAYNTCNGGEPLDAAGNPIGEIPTAAQLIKLRCLPPSGTPYGGAVNVTDVPNAAPEQPTAADGDVASIAYLFDKGRY